MHFIPQAAGLLALRGLEVIFHEPEAKTNKSMTIEAKFLEAMARFFGMRPWSLTSLVWPRIELLAHTKYFFFIHFSGPFDIYWSILNSSFEVLHEAAIFNSGRHQQVIWYSFEQPGRYNLSVSSRNEVSSSDVFFHVDVVSIPGLFIVIMSLTPVSSLEQKYPESLFSIQNSYPTPELRQGRHEREDEWKPYGNNFINIFY